MPYIKPERRKRFQKNVSALAKSAENYGDLNYLLTTLLDGYLNKTKRKYDDYNSVIGCLESCKLEMYRRRIAEYENEKILENTDVFPTIFPVFEVNNGK